MYRLPDCEARVNLYHIYPGGRGGYDSYDGHVVRAETPEKAVELCKAIAGDEGADAYSTEECTILASNVEGAEEIVLSSFNAG